MRDTLPHMGTTRASDSPAGFDWSSVRAAAVAIVVGGLLAGASAGGVVVSLAGASQQQKEQALVSFDGAGEDGEYYVAFRLRGDERPPAKAQCFPKEPGEAFRRCFAPSGVATSQTLSEADAQAVADATAAQLRQEFGDNVQTNNITINSGDDEATEEDGRPGFWTVLAGLVGIVALAWGFWTGREHLSALRGRLRPAAPLTAEDEEPSDELRQGP